MSHTTSLGWRGFSAACDKTKPRGRAGREVLQQHVGALQQPIQHVARLFVLQVQRDRPLGAVEPDEMAGKAVHEAVIGAREIALARALDLDTSAPRSARWRLQIGAATACSSAMTRMPSRGRTCPPSSRFVGQEKRRGHAKSKRQTPTSRHRTSELRAAQPAHRNSCDWPSDKIIAIRRELAVVVQGSEVRSDRTSPHPLPQRQGECYRASS